MFFWCYGIYSWTTLSCLHFWAKKSVSISAEPRLSQALAPLYMVPKPGKEASFDSAIAF